MSTSAKGGDSSIIRVKVVRGNLVELFEAVTKFQNELNHKGVKDVNRRSQPIKPVLEMTHHYIPVRDDNIIQTKTGFISLKKFSPAELFHTRTSWEAIGIKRGMLPTITYTDPHTGMEEEVPMTMNGIPIDIHDPSVIARMQSTIAYPASLMHETLDMIESTYCKYFDDSERVQRHQQSPFAALERVQRTLIVIQNLAFIQKAQIREKIRKITERLPTNRDDMIKVKELLLLNIAMLELAEPQLTKSFDHDIATMLIDSYHDQIGESSFTNPCVKLAMAELISEIRSDRDHGMSIDLDITLDKAICVFKYEEQEGTTMTLQTALMASTAEHMPRRNDHPGRIATGGDRTTPGGDHVPLRRRAENTPTELPQDENKVLNAILQRLNDIKSDLGSLKKVVLHTDNSKSDVVPNLKKVGWRNNEQEMRSEKKTRFAGVAATKGAKKSRPQPLLTSKTYCDSSFDSDDQEAYFAVGGVNAETINPFNHRIMTAQNNVIALGYKCLEPPRSNKHAYQGSELRGPQLTSLRPADSIQHQNRLQSMEINDPKTD